MPPNMPPHGARLACSGTVFGWRFYRSGRADRRSDNPVARTYPDRYCLRFASARVMPSGVRGPVDRPPWNRHRLLPGSGRAWQGCPSRWRLAPHSSRCPFIALPRSCRDLGVLPPESFARACARKGVLIPVCPAGLLALSIGFRFSPVSLAHSRRIASSTALLVAVKLPGISLSMRASKIASASFPGT